MTVPIRLNDLFTVIHSRVADLCDRQVLLKTLRMMIRHRDRLVMNNMLIEVARVHKDALKNRIAVYDRECAARVDDVFAMASDIHLAAMQTPAIPGVNMPLTLVVNAMGFDKVVIDYGNGRQVTLASI